MWQSDYVTEMNRVATDAFLWVGLWLWKISLFTFLKRKGWAYLCHLKRNVMLLPDVKSWSKLSFKLLYNLCIELDNGLYPGAFVRLLNSRILWLWSASWQSDVTFLLLLETLFLHLPIKPPFFSYFGSYHLNVSNCFFL